MSGMTTTRFGWLRTGQEGLAAMLRAIEQAQSSVGLEIYILQKSEIGDRFRTALADAARRGVRVRVLVDAFGSFELPRDYLRPVEEAGGDCRWFNPLELRRLTYRDHRKILVVDDEVAFIGGFNIGTTYDGDGVTSGWRDLGMVVRGETVGELVKAFHGMFGAASFRHQRLARFRTHLQQQQVTTRDGDLFFLSPGRGRDPLRQALCSDILAAKRIQLTTAYFLPPRRLRRALVAAARRGAEVQILLPGCCDVLLAQYAARGHYTRLLRAGVQIYEYNAAVLHTKCYIVDDLVYVGSANLDLRSLTINYEVLLRTEDAALAAEGRAIFEADLGRSDRILKEEWVKRPWWKRMLESLAGTILVRLDLQIAMRQLSRLRVNPARLRRFRKEAAESK